MANLRFNAEEHEPSSDFTPVPAGWYTVVIVESDMKETKSGNGHYLEMIAKVISGDYTNRQFFIRLNIDNPNETAVRIAQEQLSAICHAVNVMQVNDSEELHNIPFELKVNVKAATDQYEASNEVKGFRAIEGGASQSSSSKSAGNSPSWANEPSSSAKAAPEKKSAPAKKAQAVLVMVDKEYTYEEWKETGRSDQEMVDEGIARWEEAEEKKAPPAKKSPPAKKNPSNGSAADSGSTREAPADDAEGELPPWMR